MLGTGGIIYQCMEVAVETMAEPGCRDNINLAESIMAFIFIIAEIALLLVYTKVGARCFIIIWNVGNTVPFGKNV